MVGTFMATVPDLAQLMKYVIPSLVVVSVNPWEPVILRHLFSAMMIIGVTSIAEDFAINAV